MNLTSTGEYEEVKTSFPTDSKNLPSLIIDATQEQQRGVVGFCYMKIFVGTCVFMVAGDSVQVAVPNA
ncbi:hypothetical protein F441_17320 [Phytophthora nicotianae CJ01A1]|uniref:Uncharacterized protein n=2 Tax=Phytophthora nicotianae TaxID=4792 RepID=W2I9H7_PHYNI|nr:hypothetical protein L915_16974 [Phytophthora nicotianae]ETL30102.1 hypothetical protein L916_16873 [Phytophthora nicotianae]ETP06236.1 hypothetical protein F441_17320 [Phytophthora nicotianae CJ01A1]